MPTRLGLVSLSSLVLLAGMLPPRAASAQNCVPLGECDELATCPVCPEDDPNFGSSADGNIAPWFTRSPGGERGRELLGRAIDLVETFDFGSTLTAFSIPDAQINQSAVDFAEGFDQSGLPDTCYADAYEDHTSPIVPIPPQGGVAVPVDQGGSRTPDAGGAARNTAEAEHILDPVNPANGELYIEHVDLAFPGFGVDFSHGRTYRSRIDYVGVLGPGWDHTYNRRLLVLPDAERVETVVQPTGSSLRYPTVGALAFASVGVLGDHRPHPPRPTCGPELLYLTGHGTTLRFRQVSETATTVFYESADGVHRTLRGARVDDDLTWTLSEPGGVVERFDETGLLVSIQDPNGVGLTIGWQAAAGDWRVASVTDSVGRVAAYGYDSAGRLASVREARSGLGATYTYASGRLARAIDSTGRAESYEYDYDASRTGGAWGPEGYLVEACENACAPAASSCDAGGACDDPVDLATRECMTTCQRCGSDCVADVCVDGCTAACDAGTAATPGCRARCSTECAGDVIGGEIAAHCEAVYADFAQDECEACEDACEAADTGCDIASLCIQVAGGFDDGGSVDSGVAEECMSDSGKLLALGEDLGNFLQGLLGGLVDLVSCGAGTVCGWFGGDCGDCDFDNARDQFEEMCDMDYRQCCRDGDRCAESSCNAGHGCVEDCRAAFIGEANGNDCAGDDGGTMTVDQWATQQGCEPRLRQQCAPRCKTECRATCVPDCRGVCEDGCADACHSDDCPGYCDGLDLMGACEEGCVDGCIAEAHEVGPFVGAKYGYPRDLNHNIRRIRDGNGAIYLDVTYGTDLAKPNFDRVVAQTYGGFAGRIDYRDLEGEWRGHVAAPTSGPDATFIQGRDAFTPIDICPSACAPPTDRTGGEMAGWGDLLFEFASKAMPGGLPVDSSRGQRDPMAPDILLLVRDGAGARATSVAEARPRSAGEPQRGRFDVLMPQGRLVFAPAGWRSYAVSGRKEALDALLAHGSVTVFSGGAGRVRVYPGQPRSIVRVVAGRCDRPFSTQISGGKLTITPAAACTKDLAVAPLATLVTSASTKEAVLARGREALEGLDLFAASALVPARQQVSWRQPSTTPGRYDLIQGSDAGGEAQRDAIARASSHLPLAVPPGTVADLRGPLFVFHDLEPRTADGPPPGPRDGFGDHGAIFDDPADGEFLGVCSPARPAPPRSGIGPVPVSAAVMTDFYGVAWTYYFDRAGRVIRSINQGTGAVRSTSYDAAGDVTGTLGPLGERTCFARNADGNVVDVFDFPATGALGRTEPVRHHYRWGRGPARLLSVSDPRGTNLTTAPTRTLATLEWDARGNLRKIQRPGGQIVTFDLVGGTGPARGMPARQVDASQAVTQLVYDTTAGVLTRTVEGVGRVDAVTHETLHDAAGRPLTIKSPLGEVTTLGWTGGRLTSINRAGGALAEQTTLVYDADGQITAVKRDDRETRFTYTPIGGLATTRVVALDGSAAASTRCTRYGPSGRLLEEVSPEGARTIYQYDGEGRRTRVDAGALAGTGAGTWDDACPATFTGVAASGTVERMTYDRSGRLVQVVDGRNLVLTVRSDGFGRPATVTDGNGTSYRTGYDELGNVVWRSSHGRGSTTPYGAPQWNARGISAEELLYDDAARPIEHRTWHWGSDGAAIGDGYATTKLAYDPIARSVKVTDDTGAATTYRTDPAGRVDNVLLATGAAISTKHLAGGKTIERSWPALSGVGLRRETTSLTPWGEIASVTTLDAGTLVTLTRVEYDAHRRAIATVDPAGRTTTTKYDAFDRPVLRTDTIDGALAEAATLVWNRSGDLISRASAGGAARAVSRFDHDALGRVVARTDPRGAVTKLAYVLASDAQAIVTDPRGASVVSTYDLAGRLTALTATSPDGELETRRFARDGIGRVTEASHVGGLPAWAPTSILTRMGWDSLGDRVFETSGSGSVGDPLRDAVQVRHAYDGRGLVARSIYGTTDVRRTYDVLGRLATVGLGATTAVTFGYSSIGPPLQRTDAGALAGSDASRTTYGYDALARLNAITVKTPANASLARWRWDVALDEVPRIARFKPGSAAETSSVYTADGAGRLRSETHGIAGLPAQTIAPSATSTAANAVVQASVGVGSAWTRYALDGRHNLTTVDRPAGSFSPGADLADQYARWDGRALTHDGDGSLKSDGQATFEYNAFGELVHIEPVGGDAADARTYVRDAFGRVVLEGDDTAGGGLVTRYAHDGARAPMRLHHGAQQVTVDGTGVDEHLFQVGNGPYPAFTYLHQERSGNVYLATDRAGAPTEWYRYTAYGQVAITAPNGEPRAESAIANRFGFQGHPYDAAVGLVDMRLRTYHPELGRFITRDPLGLAGGPNLYAFVDGSPLRYVDPFGLDKDLPWYRDAWNGVAWVGGRVGAGAAAVGGFAYDVGAGFVDGAVDTAVGLYSAVRNPGQTAAGLWSAASHPIRTTVAVGGALRDFGGALASGDGRAWGRLTFEIAGAAVGAGAGKLGKLSKLDEAADVARAASAVEAASTASKADAIGYVFWSGHDPAKNAAVAFAERTGGTTLEMSDVGRQLEAATATIPWDEAKPRWQAASKDFAERASGTVDVFLARVPGPLSVWREIEKNALLNNPAVVRIRYHLALIGD